MMLSPGQILTGFNLLSMRIFFCLRLRQLFLLLPILAILLIVSCAQNAVKLSPLPKYEKATAVKLNWRVNLGRGSRLQLRHQSPAEAGDVVYLCDWRRLIALNLTNGKRLWRKKLGAPISGCLAHFGERIYLSDEDGIVYAINAENGDIIWQKQLDADSVTPPTANENVVLIQTVSEKLYALNANDGAQLWSYSAYNPGLTLFGSFHPIIIGNIAISGFADGSVVVFDWSSGNPVSFRQISVPQGQSDIERLVDIDATAIFDEGRLYMSSYGGTTLGLDLRSGTEIWRNDIGSFLTMAQDSERLFVVDKDNRIYAIKKSDGEIIWEREDYLYRGLTAPVLFDDYLAMGDRNGQLHVFASEDGSPVGRRKMGLKDIINFMVATSEGILLIDKEGFVNMLQIEEKFQ